MKLNANSREGQGKSWSPFNLNFDPKDSVKFIDFDCDHPLFDCVQKHIEVQAHSMLLMAGLKLW